MFKKKDNSQLLKDLYDELKKESNKIEGIVGKKFGYFGEIKYPRIDIFKIEELWPGEHANEMSDFISSVCKVLKDKNGEGTLLNRIRFISVAYTQILLHGQVSSFGSQDNLLSDESITYLKEKILEIEEGRKYLEKI